MKIPTSLTWGDVHTTISIIVNLVIASGKVYYGGSASTMDECTVYCYDPRRDKWSTLPPLPVRYFGLSRIDEELIAIGGVNIDADEPINKVHVYDSKLERWKEMIAVIMPSARAFPSVMSVQLGLIVAGGLIQLYNDEYTDIVEIYALGESDGKQSDLEDTTRPKALYASVDDLISNAVPVNKTLQCDTGSTHSAYKMLPHTPCYQPAATALGAWLFSCSRWMENVQKRSLIKEGL